MISESEETLEVTPLASVENFDVSDASVKKIGLKWDGVDSNASAIEIQRQVDGGSWMTVRVMQPERLGWDDMKVLAGHTYRYRVRVLGLDSDLDSEYVELLTEVEL